MPAPPRDYLRGLLLDFLKSYVSGYTADFITIADLFISSCAKRQTTLETTPCDAVAQIKFADFPSASAQSISATLVADYEGVTLDLSSVPISVPPLDPLSGNAPPGHGSGGNSVKLIVAVVVSVCGVVAVLAVLLLGWFCVRRKGKQAL